MPEQTPLTIVDLIGMVGALAGLAGGAFSYLIYRRFRHIKTLDLRLELRRQVASVQDTITDLPDLLQASRRSRESVRAARGTLHDADHVGWKEAWARDLAAAIDLSSELLRRDLVQFEDAAQLCRAGATGDGVQPGKLFGNAGVDRTTDIAGLEQLVRLEQGAHRAVADTRQAGGDGQEWCAWHLGLDRSELPDQLHDRCGTTSSNSRKLAAQRAQP